MIYFTSDLHLGDEKIIEEYHRPFYDVLEMNDKLISNINSVVMPDDDLYILGDFSYYELNGDKVKKLFLNIKCKHIHLIKGDHDLQEEDLKTLGVFESISDYKEIKVSGNLYVLCHYPISVGNWNKGMFGSYHLHGHIHTNKFHNYVEREKGIRKYDVGVDANDYFPVSIKQIEDFYNYTPMVETRKIRTIDEDGEYNMFMLYIKMKHKEDYEKLDKAFVDECGMIKLDEGIYNHDVKKEFTCEQKVKELEKTEWFRSNRIEMHFRDSSYYMIAYDYYEQRKFIDKMIKK